jgi:hypothetical protein
LYGATRSASQGGKRRLADPPGRDDEGHRHVAVPLVGTAHDAGVRDGRMLDQQRFELGRRYLTSAMGRCSGAGRTPSRTLS